MVKVGHEWTTGTLGCPAAVCLAYGNGECMELVEKTDMIAGRVRGKCFPGELDQGFIAPAVVPGRSSEQLMAFCDATQVFVCYGYGVMKRIEQDGIGGFRAHALKGKQATAQGWGSYRCQLFERTFEFLIQHGDKGLKRGSFASEKAGRPNQFLQVFEG
jgi:hypothetical protein